MNIGYAPRIINIWEHVEIVSIRIVCSGSILSSDKPSVESHCSCQISRLIGCGVGDGQLRKSTPSIIPIVPSGTLSQGSWRVAPYFRQATLAFYDHKGAVCAFSPGHSCCEILFLGDVIVVFTSVERDCSVTPAWQTNCSLVLDEYLSSNGKNLPAHF